MLRLRTSLAAVALVLAACNPRPQQQVVQGGANVTAPEAHSHRATVPSGNQAPTFAAASTSAQPTPAPEHGAVEQQGRHALPTECYTDGELCLPPPDFVDRLCRAAHIGTAMRLFAKTSPFTRAYVRMREVRAVNLRGGPASDNQLTFAEEVLLLARHGGSDDMEVSGVGGYDVLRWDGTCATLASDEVVMRVPAPPRYAPFAWKHIDDTIQDALLEREAIRSARAAERQRCRGSSDSEASLSCRDAAERLADYVVVAIRGGIDLPSPEYTP